MSDPMTNMEIEDVLSSIRRLVSEDLRPAPRDSSAPASRAGPAPAPASRPAPAPASRPAEPEGKLVLTPAFRISEPASVKPEEPPVWRRAASRYRTESAETGDLEPEAGSDDPAEPLPDLTGDGPLPFSPALPKADLAALSGQQDFAGGQDEAAVPPETALMEQQAAAAPEADTPFAPDAAPAAVPVTDTATLEAAIAELEAAVAASGEDWEPDGSEMASGDHFVLPPMGAGRVMAEAADAFGLRQSSGQPGLRRLHLEPGSYQEDPSEPVWAEPVPEAAKRPANSLAETGQENSSMFADEETLLDEGMLRELVIGVIRQELQGALGERITRNVRKLVRAEIHRAMAGREFE